MELEVQVKLQSFSSSLEYRVGYLFPFSIYLLWVLEASGGEPIDYNHHHHYIFLPKTKFKFNGNNFISRFQIKI